VPLDDVSRPTTTGARATDADVPVRCARCGHALTTARARIAVDGAHAHTFVNPSGVVFDIVLYADAPGAIVGGEHEVHTSWFPGTAWQYASCGACAGHVGWAYVYLRAHEPQRFVGFIVDCVIEGSDGRGA
jgi:hypothetical protein